MRRRAFTASALAALAAPAAAQDWPTKPLRMVIPYPPGGPSDVSTRIVCSVSVKAPNRRRRRPRKLKLFSSNEMSSQFSIPSEKCDSISANESAAASPMRPCAADPEISAAAR